MKNPFLFIIIAASCLSSIQVSAQQAIVTPILKTLPNFRDIAGISASNGGTGFANPVANNGVMRPGVFYRTDAPSLLNASPWPPLSQADWNTLSTLGVETNIDLRTPREIELAPDVALAGAAYRYFNILGTKNKPTIVHGFFYCNHSNY